MGFTGGWRTQALTEPATTKGSIGYARDPGHADPEYRRGQGTPDWSTEHSGSAGTPAEWVEYGGTDTWTDDDPSPVVLMDHTPLNHKTGGGGYGPGRPEKEIRVENARLHAEDLGALSYRRHSPPVPGDSTMRVGIEQLPIEQGGNPADLKWQMSSDPEVSPNARRDRRLYRVDDRREFQTMRWDADERPRTTTGPQRERDKPPLSGGPLPTSPFPSLMRAIPTTVPKPQLRRAPDPTWTDDGVDDPGDHGANNGFLSWGL